MVNRKDVIQGTLNKPNCSSHRMIMISSDFIYPNKKNKEAKPTQIVKWKCFSCKLENELKFDC